MFAPVERYRGIVVWSLYGLFLITSLLRVVGHAGVWLMPIPIAVQVASYRGSRDKLVIPVAMTLVDSLVIGLSGFRWTTILFGIGIYLLAEVMGDAIKRKSPILAPLTAGSFVFVMLELVVLAQFRTIWTGQWIHHVSMRLTNGYAPETFALFFDQTHSQNLILPGILCIIAVLFSMLNFEICRLLTWTSKTQIIPIIAGWRLPLSMAILYLLSLVVLMFGWGSSLLLWWKFVNSTFCLASFFIGVQGVSVIWRYIARFHWRYLTIGIVILLAPILGSVYTIVGLIDLLNHPQRRLG